jgi:hypothetical protein
MTKPKRKKARADDWTFDMPAGLATHHPTQLEYRLEPRPSGVISEARALALEAQGYSPAGECWLAPNGQGLQIDRRDPAKIAPGHANAPGVTHWTTLTHHGARQAVLDKLRADLDTIGAGGGLEEALKRLRAICRDAGDGWIYRVRLERAHKN